MRVDAGCSGPLVTIADSKCPRKVRRGGTLRPHFGVYYN